MFLMNPYKTPMGQAWPCSDILSSAPTCLPVSPTPLQALLLPQSILQIWPELKGHFFQKVLLMKDLKEQDAQVPPTTAELPVISLQRYWSPVEKERDRNAMLKHPGPGLPEEGR